MASNHTENIGLNQWELSDSILMEDFNADNQKIDAALAALRPRFQLGSYVGTGLNGPEHPTTLTFDFDPKIVIISGAESETALGITMIMLRNAPCARGAQFQGDPESTQFLTWGDKTLSWHGWNNTDRYHANHEGTTYYYLAIG